jgi:hypothetical protein
LYSTIAWATDCAAGLARQLHGTMAIIHVQEVIVGRGGIFVDEAAVAALHRTAQQLRDEGIETTVLVSRAPPRTQTKRLSTSPPRPPPT